MDLARFLAGGDLKKEPDRGRVAAAGPVALIGRCTAGDLGQVAVVVGAEHQGADSDKP